MNTFWFEILNICAEKNEFAKKNVYIKTLIAAKFDCPLENVLQNAKCLGWWLAQFFLRKD